MRASLVVLAVAGMSACSGDSLGPPADFTPLPSGVTLQLDPGEFMTFTAATTAVEIPAAAASRSYVVVIQNVGTTPGPETSVRLRVARLGSPASASIGHRAGGGRAVPPAARTGPGDPFDAWYARDESRFRGRVRDALRRAGARPVVPGAGARRSSTAPPSARASRVGSAPVAGDLLEFGSPVQIDGSLATCTSTSRVTGRVRVVGPRFVIVEDTLVSGPMSDADYAAILDEIERVAFPVDSAYFGLPSDVDGNGKVIALVTAEVNRLGAAGFFTASDLAAGVDCPASNEGEVLWLIAPDPLRQFGFDPIPTDVIRSRLPGVIAHELQHLIHAERRIFEAGGDFESADEPWLNEGLSHIAEEVSGLYAGGLRSGSNVDYADLAVPEVFERFDRYHFNNFRFVRDYLRSPGSVPALSDQPVTRGELRRARGYGYLLLRWLADRYAAEGSAGLVSSVREEAFFRELTVGGSALRRSVDNIAGALSSTLGVVRPWPDLFAEYAATLAVDDVGTAEVPLAPELGLPTWNLPGVYANARDRGLDLDFPEGFPLQPTLLLLGTLPPVGFTQTVDLLPSTAVYFRVEGVRETPFSQLSLRGGDGEPLPTGSAIQVTIVRAF